MVSVANVLQWLLQSFNNCTVIIKHSKQLLFQTHYIFFFLMLFPSKLRLIALFITHTDSIIKANCSLYQTLCWSHYQNQLLSLSNVMLIPLSKPIALFIKCLCWSHYQNQLLSLSYILIPLSKPIALFIKHYADLIIKTNCSLYQTLCWSHYQNQLLSLSNIMLIPLSKPLLNHLYCQDDRSSLYQVLKFSLSHALFII